MLSLSFCWGSMTRSSVEIQKKWEWNDDLDLFLGWLGWFDLTLRIVKYVCMKYHPASDKWNQANLSKRQPRIPPMLLMISSFQPGIMSASMYLWCGGPQNAGHVDNSVINPASQTLPSLIGHLIKHNHLTPYYFADMLWSAHIFLCWHVLHIFSHVSQKTPKSSQLWRIPTSCHLSSC